MVPVYPDTTHNSHEHNEIIAIKIMKTDEIPCFSSREVSISHRITGYINRCRHANNHPEIPTDLLAYKDPPKEIPVYEISLPGTTPKRSAKEADDHQVCNGVKRESPADCAMI